MDARYTVADKLSFRAALEHAITASDIVESRKRGYNRYALAIMLRASDDVVEAVQKGADPAHAFADSFTPTRQTHAVARSMRFALDVSAGCWVFPSSPTPSTPV